MKRCGAVAILILAGAGTAHAQEATTFDELRQRGLLATGDQVSVRDSAGETLRGRVGELTDDRLTIHMDPRRGPLGRTFTEFEVTRIQRQGSRALLKSTAVGAGVMLAVTAGLAAAYGANEGGGMCGGCLAQWAAVAVPVGAGVGALIGFTIDRANTRTVFAAPTHRKVLVTPLASPHAIGALATIRF